MHQMVQSVCMHASLDDTHMHVCSSFHNSYPKYRGRVIGHPVSHEDAACALFSRPPYMFRPNNQPLHVSNLWIDPNFMIENIFGNT